MKLLEMYSSTNEGIYQIRNEVNGKKYVGKSINMFNRYKQHKRRLDNNTHFNKHLQDSYNKHGRDNFIFEVIRYGHQTYSLEMEEQMFLDTYVNWGYDYNIQKKSVVPPRKTKNCFKPILQWSKERILIKKWESIKSAADTLNINNSHISNVISKRLSTAGGYIWTNINEKFTDSRYCRYIKVTLKKEILYFPSTKEFKEKFPISRTFFDRLKENGSINKYPEILKFEFLRTGRGNYPTNKGRKLTEKHKQTISKNQLIPVGAYNENRELQFICKSIKDAAKLVGCKPCSISASCSGRKNKIKGYYWKKLLE